MTLNVNQKSLFSLFFLFFSLILTEKTSAAGVNFSCSLLMLKVTTSVHAASTGNCDTSMFGGIKKTQFGSIEMPMRDVSVPSFAGS